MSESGQPTCQRNGNASDPTEQPEVSTQKEGTDTQSPSGSVGMTAPSTSGDEESSSTPKKIQKRIVHNAVERRRKVKINNYIFTLAKHLPNRDGRKWSKNETLEKTVEYIEEIKTAHEKLMLGQLDEVQVGEFNRMKQRIEDLEQKNRTYAKLLEIAGIPLNGEAGAPWPATLGDSVNPEHLYMNEDGELAVRTPAEQAAAESAKRRNRHRRGSGSLERTTPSSNSSSSCVSSPAVPTSAPLLAPTSQRGVDSAGNGGVAGDTVITNATSGATAVTQALSAAPIMSTNLHQVASSSPSTTTTLLPQQMSLLNFGGGANGLNLIQTGAASTTMQPMITINDQGIPVIQMVATTTTGAGGQMVLNAGSTGGHGLLQADLSYLQQALCGAGFVQGDSSTGGGGVVTVNGTGSELPSALMLPNGQIIPVVREPSLLYQNASGGTSVLGSGNLVVTSSGASNGVMASQSLFQNQVPQVSTAGNVKNITPAPRPSTKSDSSLMTLLPRQPIEQLATSDVAGSVTLPKDAPPASEKTSETRRPTAKSKPGKITTKKLVSVKRPRDIKPKAIGTKKTINLSKKASAMQLEPLVTSAAVMRCPTPPPPPPPLPTPPPSSPAPAAAQSEFFVEAVTTVADDTEAYRPSSAISRSGSRCLGGANDILARATESIFSNSLSDVSSSPNPGYFDDGGGGGGTNPMDLMQGFGGGGDHAEAADSATSPLPGQFSSLALSTSSADSGIASGGDSDKSRLEQHCPPSDRGGLDVSMTSSTSGDLLENLVGDRQLPENLSESSDRILSGTNGELDSYRRRRQQHQPKRSSCEQESLTKRSKTSSTAQEDARHECVRLTGKQPLHCGSDNSPMTGVEVASEPSSAGGGGGSGVNFLSISQLASSSAAVSSSKSSFLSLDGTASGSPLFSVSPMQAGSNLSLSSSTPEAAPRADDNRFSSTVSSTSHPPPFSSHQTMFGPSIGNYPGQFQYTSDSQPPRPPFGLTEAGQQQAACSMSQTSTSRGVHGVGTHHHRNQKQTVTVDQPMPPFAPHNARFQGAPSSQHHPHRFANPTNNPMEMSLHQSFMRGSGSMGSGPPFSSPANQVCFGGGQSYSSAPLSHLVPSPSMAPQRFQQSGSDVPAKSKSQRRSATQEGCGDDGAIMSPPTSGPPPRMQRSPLTGVPLGHDSAHQQQQRGHNPLFPAMQSPQRMHQLLHHSPQGGVGNGTVSPVGQPSPVAGGRSNPSASPQPQHQLSAGRGHSSTSPVHPQSHATSGSTTTSPGAPFAVPRRSPQTEAPLRSPTYHLDPYTQPYLFAGQKQLSNHPATSMASTASSRTSIYSAESLIQSGERPNCAQEGQPRARSSPHLIQQQSSPFGVNCGNRQPSHINGGQPQASGLPYLPFQQPMSGGLHQQSQQAHQQQHATPSGGNKSGAGWSHHQQNSSSKPRSGGGNSSQTSPQAGHSQPNFSFSLMPSGGNGDGSSSDSRQQMPSQNNQLGLSPHLHQQQQMQQQQSSNNYPPASVRPTYQPTANTSAPQHHGMYPLQHQHQLKESSRLSASTMSFPPVGPHFFPNHHHPQMSQARPGLPHHGAGNPFTEMYHAAVHGANLNHGGNGNSLGTAINVGGTAPPCKQPRGSTAKQEAKKSKQSQPSKRKLQQQQLQHQSYNVEEVNLSNSIFETGGRSLTPYFAVPNLSPPRNEVPTYLPHPPNPLFNNGLGAQRSVVPHQSGPTGKGVGEHSSPPPYNMLSGGPNASRGGGTAAQGLNLNFQSGFNPHHHHHLHGASGHNQMAGSSSSGILGSGGAHGGSNVTNFNVSNMLPDMGGGNSESVKFHHGNHLLGAVAPSDGGASYQMHHHHQSGPVGVYPTSSSSSSSSSNRGMLHNGSMSINTLLGHHNPHVHPGASSQVSVNNMAAGTTPTFHGHAPPAFGNVPTLNFALHDH